MNSPLRPEHWEVDVGDDDVAHLDIPPHAQRDRTFEVSVDFTVRSLPGHDAPWHELRVLLNGAQQWARRIAAQHDSADSLDYRVRCQVPVGEPMRITAATEIHGVRRLALRIIADEEA